MSDASALLHQMQRGDRTSRDIVREHLERLQQLQPTLNAATEILAEQALAQAEAPRPGPLSGLPITLKETYALEGHDITCGSRRMPPIPCDEDAPVVAKLKAAGAIVMARSNVPEFVMTAETRNLRYGRTSNPLNPDRVAGGSSGGEGALVGSGASPLGFGTDILGSIRIPACCCGIVGFRPHSGALDKTGVWPVSGEFFESWNGIGPMARSVRDVRLAYDVMADQALPAIQDPAGLRLIAPTDFPFRIDDACIRAAYDAALSALKSAGLKREAGGSFADVRKLFLDVPRLVTGEMIPLWTEWLSRGGARFSPYIEALRQLLRRPTVDPGFFLWFALISPLYRPRRPAALHAVIEHFQQARQHYHQLLGNDGILCLPTLGMLAPRHGAMNRLTLTRPGLNPLVTAHTFANYINLSAISVPAWRHRDTATGLVPGVMLACAPGAEGALLDAAAALETALNPPRTPSP